MPAPSPVFPTERKQLTVLCARLREAIDGSDPETTLAQVDPALEAMVDAVLDAERRNHRLGDSGGAECVLG